jgi:hypothetical protein
MPEQFNILFIALLFAILIGSWLLANALVDLAARRFRLWLAAHWGWFAAHWQDADAPAAQRDPRLTP